MKTPNGTYHESKDFNPALAATVKSLFAVRRYTLNILILAAALIIMLVPDYHGLASRVTAETIAGLFLILMLSLRIAFEWERVPILRMGRFIKTKGPGVFFLVPFVDIPYGYVDTRIVVTDFSAYKVLTKDTVPVYVDAVIFWMIWDASKAKLEVENYHAAVPLSAKTALRDIIGKTSLSRLLTDRDGIGSELQKVLDARTNPWGITSLSVEIKDILIPEELEDAMSKEAQAEREKNARVILGTAEVELSEKYRQASDAYHHNREAMALRSMHLLLEAVNNKGSMILVPSEIPHLMDNAVAIAMAKKADTVNPPSSMGGEGVVSP